MRVGGPDAGVDGYVCMRSRVRTLRVLASAQTNMSTHTRACEGVDGDSARVLGSAIADQQSNCDSGSDSGRGRPTTQTNETGIEKVSIAHSRMRK